MMFKAWWNSQQGGCRRPATGWGWSVLIAIFLATADGHTADAPESAPILDAMDRALERLRGQEKPFQDAMPDIDWAENLDVLAKILGVRLTHVATVDEARVRDRFRGIGDATLQRLLQQWGLPFLDAEQYMSVPFFVDAGAEEIRFVVSEKIAEVPASKKLFYALLLKSQAALPTPLKAPPSAWSCGLSSLIAADLAYPTFVAALPDLETEAAIAALLFSKAPSLLRESFQPEDRFDKRTYDGRLIEAIRTAGAADPEKAFQELMRSPEEYNCQDQGERQQLANDEEEARPWVPYVHPAMEILWQILPADEHGLRATADDLAKNIRNTTLRLILLNACYDKLCAVVGMDKVGTFCDSGLLLRNAVKAKPDDLGIDNDDLLGEFERRSGEALDAFRQELAKRPLKEQEPKGIAYDPAALKWTFRFLYNHSAQIRRAEEKLREELRQQQPEALDIQLDKLLTETVTADMVRAWWKTDDRIAGLFQTVGEPVLQLLPSMETDTGKELICTWTLNRHRTNEKEEVRIRIVDSFSSGGGQPQPGVYAEAQVIVRRAPGAEPEEIELGKIEPNYYVRTLSSLEVERAEEDWARVVTVQRDQTRAPWELVSGGARPLATGRKQMVRAKLKEGAGSIPWEWRLPLAVHSGGDELLGIRPEHASGPEGTAGLYPAPVQQSSPGAQRQSLVVISLSHREVLELQEAGEQHWGYFADARFVQAPVFPTPPGVDGKAIVEVPEGGRALETIAAAAAGGEGDQIKAFEYGNPRAFVDLVLENESQGVDYFIELVYTLPGHREKTSLRVAEGQKLILWDPAEEELSWREAYRLRPGMELVCAFTNATPQTAVLKEIRGIGEPLGVYQLKLKACPLVRANGILVPVDVDGTTVCAGVEENSLIQMSPGLDAIRGAEEDAEGNHVRIDLTSARVELAKNLPKAADNRAGNADSEETPVRDSAADSSADDADHAAGNFLCYNTTLLPRRFWSTGLSQEEPMVEYETRRYIKIDTPQATLLCGHLQEIYATTGDSWRGLTEIQASRLEPGKHQVVWLRSSAGPVSWSDAAEAQEHVGRIADWALSRVAEGTDIAGARMEAGAVALVPVVSVQEMHIDADLPEFRFREFIAADTRIARLGLRPTLFANAILVKMRFEDAGQGQDPGGGRGPHHGTPETPEEKGPGKYQPNYVGVIRDLPPQLAKVHYSSEDMQVFQENLTDLKKAFRERRMAAGAVRQPVLERFLRHYVEDVPPLNVVLSDTYLQQQFRNYVDARGYLIQTGELQVTPAVMNGYLMLATLLYEAGAATAGDALTRDYLCLLIRTINKPPGKEFYAGSPRVKYAFRDGLLVVRDVLPYVRDKSQQDGFEPVASSVFPAYRFQDILRDYFVAQEGCNEDICAGGNVSLYNLCRQLDKWSGVKLQLFESVVAPGFQSAKLFESHALRQRLGTRGQ